MSVEFDKALPNLSDISWKIDHLLSQMSPDLLVCLLD